MEFRIDDIKKIFNLGADEGSPLGATSILRSEILHLVQFFTLNKNLSFVFTSALAFFRKMSSKIAILRDKMHG